LARTPLRPNHVTSARLATGLGACVCFATGHALGIGILLFLFSFVCDRVDGELARQTGRVSESGHYYDLISDAICNSGVLIAIGVGLRAGPLGVWAVALGLVAGLSVAATFALVVRVELARGAGTVSFPARHGVDPDDAMLLIPFAMLLHWGEALIICAALGAPISALIIWRELRTRVSSAATQT